MEQPKTEEKPQEKKVASLEDLKKKAGEKKRPRGRQKGWTKKKKEAEAKAEAEEPQAPPVGLILEAESTQAVLDWLFKTVAERAGPWWVLKPQESQAGAKVINALVVKRTPAIAQYAEEIAVIVWAFGVTAPRYQKTMAAQAAQAEQEAAQERGEESLVDSLAPGSRQAGGDGGEDARK